MIPQIIYIVIIFIGLLCEAYLHGEKRKDSYNIFIRLVSVAIWTGILYWGGFFNPMFK